jgi:hypothetical protein
MTLELETRIAQRDGETEVDASLRNIGTDPVTVLLEPQLHQISARLVDDQGKVLGARDASATRGRRDFGPTVETRVLQPDESVSVAVFLLTVSPRRAIVETLSWDLTRVRSTSLTLELSYEVSAEGADCAKTLNGTDVAVGRRTSRPLRLPFRT